LRDLIRINQPFLGKEEIDAAVEVIRTGILTEKSGMGPKVLEFERSFAKFVGTKHAIALTSGTAALHAALLAADVRAGDDVLVPSFTFAATASAVLLAGARPMFVDIDKESYCMKTESIESVITRRTKAIVPVHLYGMPADMGSIMDLAHQRDLVVIDDAAQAHGTVYKGRNVGSIGNMTCFSFYAGKNLTTGEGGMITTNDDDYAKTLRMIRTHGEERPYWITRLGHNYRMSEIPASIGLAQLKKLPLFLEKRRKNAESLTEKLSMLGKLVLPRQPEEGKHSWYLYTVRLRGANAGKRNKVVEKLRAKNIEASIYYETPVHLLPLYRDSFGYKRGTLPETEKAARQVFSLPVHPKISPEDLDYIVENVKKVIV